MPTCAKSKKNSKKFDDSQARAVGYVFGVSNLALISDASLFKIVKRYATEESDSVKWDHVAGAIRAEMSRYAESDMMFRDMLEEIDSWIKDARKGSKFIIEQWEEDCKKFGVPEKHIFSKD